MEYKGFWIVFLTLWFLLGAAVAVYPVAVARLLRGERELPPSRLLTAWRGIGVIVQVGSVVKLLSVLASQWVLSGCFTNDTERRHAGYL
jgi:hypothetical protein